MIDPSELRYTTPELAAVFAPESHVRRMLDVEAGLARAQARVGVIPSSAADAITWACHGESYDVAALYAAAAEAGTLAIPLVKAIGERVGAEVHAFVHWGATSQDVIDTAFVLQARDALAPIDADLLRVCASCASLTERHRLTLMAGRTLLQQAVPIPFGLKAARWLGLAMRQVLALRTQGAASLVLQFGGAAGTLASLGDRGLAVAEALAGELDLPLPDLPWHAERDRMAALAAALGVTAGAMAKIARDVVLLAQTEVGEVGEAESPGKGGSSAMPHKQNPIDATMGLAAARLAIGQVSVVLGAMSQEHERGAGGWQAEWVALPALFRFAGGAVSRVARVLEGLQVHDERMRANLGGGAGLVMAEALATELAPHLGRAAAQQLVQVLGMRARTEGRPLRDLALEDPRVAAVLDAGQVDLTLDPGSNLGSAQAFIDRALASYREMLAADGQDADPSHR
jgi:3-carboxy-cis,cis-muconate cycloisomerase